MSPVLLALLCALGCWWLGTGVVLWLQRRLDTAATRGTRTASQAAITRAPIIATLGLVGTVAVVALVATSASLDRAASIGGFAAAICLWGAFELGWALGLIGGTHAEPCPEGVRGWSRFRLALGTSLWLEIAVLGTGVAASVLLLEASNPTGALTFIVLWLMRWSAKLNLFLGVPNFSTEWFPARHAHLASYIRRAPVSAFYPVALAAASLVAALLLHRAVQAEGDAALVYALPAVLLVLAVLEHVFLALPIADLELWNRWFARDGEARAGQP